MLDDSDGIPSYAQYKRQEQEPLKFKHRPLFGHHKIHRYSAGGEHSTKYECAESHTRRFKNAKTALTTDDLHKVVLDIFLLDCGKEALTLLETSAYEVYLEVSASLMKSPRIMYKVRNGKVRSKEEAKSFFIKLGHHCDSEIENTFPHVVTIYPQNKEVDDARGYTLKKSF